MEKETYLITGCGTGFGKEIALGLAEEGHDVIATVEVADQISALEEVAASRGVELRIEKLDVTDANDREKAWKWDVDVLINNAGVAEGGAVADIPEANLRNQFEVNIFGPILLTQAFAKKMVKQRRGKIIFISSVSGLMADPLSGPYGATKFAIEAFAESLSKELQEYAVEVAVINPGPYLTGFNDREFEAWRSWDDNPEERLFDYEKHAFPYEQFDPEAVVKETIKVATGKSKDYRTVVPKAMAAMVKKRQKELWSKKVDDELGERHELVQKSLDIEPATTPAEGVIDKIKDKLT